MRELNMHDQNICAPLLRHEYRRLKKRIDKRVYTTFEDNQTPSGARFPLNLTRRHWEYDRKIRDVMLDFLGLTREDTEPRDENGKIIHLDDWYDDYGGR